MNKEEKQQVRNHQWLESHTHCHLCGSEKSLMIICFQCYGAKKRLEEARAKWFSDVIEEQQPIPFDPEIPQDPDDEPPET